MQYRNSILSRSDVLPIYYGGLIGLIEEPTSEGISA